jgi:dipeptidyl-peptidase-4
MGHQVAIVRVTGKSPSISDRYSRAVRLLPPKIAGEADAVAVEGYWLSDHLFFFVREQWDVSLNRLIVIPSVVDCRKRRVEQVLAPEELALDVPALYSPDGRYGCFLKGYDVWLKELSSGRERPLTTNGGAHQAYGRESETGFAPVSSRESPRPEGLWSPDSQWFLTYRIDERSLPESGLLQHAPSTRGRPVFHRFKYCIPGDELPVATYMAIHVASGRIVAFEDYPVGVSGFSPFFLRMVWFGERNTAWCVRLDRYHQRVELILLDLRKGGSRVVLSEEVASGYLYLHPVIVGTPNIRTLARSSEVIWFSERDGWGHLYLYDASTGRLKNQITRGPWLVRDIVQVDEERRRVLFLAGAMDPHVDPARRTLCAVNLDGSGFEVLLSHDGDVYVPATESGGLSQDRPLHPAHAAPGVSSDGRYGVIRYGSVERTPSRSWT